jgi:hypothetical protein
MPHRKGDRTCAMNRNAHAPKGEGVATAPATRALLKCTHRLGGGSRPKLSVRISLETHRGPREYTLRKESTRQRTHRLDQCVSRGRHLLRYVVPTSRTSVYGAI